MKSNNFTRSVNKIGKWINRNSNGLLTAASVGTSIGACVEIYKKAPIAQEVLEERHEYIRINDIQETKMQSLWEDAKVVVPVMAPGIFMEAVSIASCVGSYQISTKRIGALATAYKISETTLREYQERVISKFGEHKHKEIKEEIKEDKVSQIDTSAVSCGPGQYPVIDLFANAGMVPMFAASEYDIRKAETVINNRLRNEMWVNLNDFYQELGAGTTGFGSLLGWNIDKVGERGIEINIGAAQDINGRPCLTIDYDCHLTEYYDY